MPLAIMAMMGLDCAQCASPATKQTVRASGVSAGALMGVKLDRRVCACSPRCFEAGEFAPHIAWRVGAQPPPRCDCRLEKFVRKLHLFLNQVCSATED